MAEGAAAPPAEWRPGAALRYNSSLADIFCAMDFGSSDSAYAAIAAKLATRSCVMHGDLEDWGHGEILSLIRPLHVAGTLKKRPEVYVILRHRHRESDRHHLQGRGQGRGEGEGGHGRRLEQQVLEDPAGGHVQLEQVPARRPRLRWRADDLGTVAARATHGAEPVWEPMVGGLVGTFSPP